MFHVGQVIRLHCPPAVVHARIAANAGGDRTDRMDDEAPDVDRKLAVYACQTEPLVEYYRARGAVITDITVAASTSADDLYAAL